MTKDQSQLEDAKAKPEWTWLEDNLVEVDGELFRLSPLGQTEEASFLVMKEGSLVHKYQSLIESEQPDRIIEIGTKDGGSTALLALAARPSLLISIDLAPTAPPGLTSLIGNRSLGEHVIVTTGVDQARADHLLGAISPYDDTPFDLIIDDASHLLHSTITSFDALFPHVRPGGTYIIEDWSHDHYTARKIIHHAEDRSDLKERISIARAVITELNRPGGTLPDELIGALAQVHRSKDGATDHDPTIKGMIESMLAAIALVDIEVLRTAQIAESRPLCDMAIALMLTSIEHEDLIEEVSVNPYWIAVRRGPAEIESADDFALEAMIPDHFGYLGMRSPATDSGEGGRQARWEETETISPVMYDE